METRKLTKAEIIESIQQKLELNRPDIHKVIDEFFEEVKRGLEADRVIELRVSAPSKFALAKVAKKPQPQNR